MNCFCPLAYTPQNLVLYLSIMQQRIYFDTSVFGGEFDLEFDDPTLQLFKQSL